MSINLVADMYMGMQSKIPIGRLGKPDEIASIVVMLVTNGYMTNKVSIESSHRALLLTDMRR